MRGLIISYLINLITLIRPSLLQSFIIKIIYGNSLERRKFYFLKKFNIFLFLDRFNYLGILITKGYIYENHTVDLISENLKKDSIFFDIGANEGYFSTITSRINYAGKTYAFEPLTQLIPIIEKNFLKNNCTNCKIFNVGIGEKSYTTKINTFADINTGASSIIRKNKFNNKTQSIKIQSLDEFVLNNKIYNQIDLIKIDIEGYEVKAIEGMKGLLINKRINTILIDYHMTIITQQDKKICEQFIMKCGYKKNKTEDQSMICYKLFL